MSEGREGLLSVFLEHRDALLRFLVRRLGNPALAEDLTQETWVRAASANGARTVGNPRAYLFRIAANLALDHQRHVAHRVEVESVERVVAGIADPQPSPETTAIDRAEFGALLAAVDALPPRCREVFIMARFEGATYSQVAARLGIAHSTVVTHMVTALAALERALRRKTSLDEGSSESPSRTS